MFPWSDTSAVQAAPFAVGDAIYSGTCRGAVVAVDADKATMGVVWEDSDDGKPITYPMDAVSMMQYTP